MPEALEKRQAGMTVAMRYGSATKDLDQILPFLAQQGVRIWMALCSAATMSMRMSFTIMATWTVSCGAHGTSSRKTCGAFDAEQAAIQAIAMATLHPARYFSRFFRHHGYAEMGEIAPGKIANLAILESLETLKCSTVLRRGEVVVANGDIKRRTTAGDYGGLLRSVAVKQHLKASDFTVHFGGPENVAATRVIGAKDGSLTTENKVLLLPVRDGEIGTDPSQDTAKIAVIERHHYTGSHAVGFVSGLGLLQGAVASTVGHDSHNLMVAGVDETANGGGGQPLGGNRWRHGCWRSEMKLPLYRWQFVVLCQHSSIDAVVSAVPSALGRRKANWHLEQERLSACSRFLALPVIPQLKITNRGLVDVDAFAPVPLLVD